MRYEVSLETLTGKTTGRLPRWLPNEANSLTALTGCDPRSGALYDPRSQAALVGVGRKHLEAVFRGDSNFNFVWQGGGLRVTMPDSLSLAWNDRQARIQSEQRDRMNRVCIRWETATNVLSRL